MTIRKPAPRARPSSGWLIVFIFELLALGIMSLILVWGGIERTDTTYFINVAQSEAREKKELRDKLELERQWLLAPRELRKKAEAFGMREPRVDQVRRMELK